MDIELLKNVLTLMLMFGALGLTLDALEKIIFAGTRLPRRAARPPRASAPAARPRAQVSEPLARRQAQAAEAGVTRQGLRKEGGREVES